MKLIKKIFFSLFIIIIIVAFFINIFIVRSKIVPSLDIFELDGIYFSLSLIDDKKKKKEINKFINSKNSAVFSSIIKIEDNPIARFYAFCGFLKSNQKKAVKFLDKLLISQKKVNIIIDDKNRMIGYPFGLAILILIKEFPDNLTNPHGEGFFLKSKDALLKAYKSKIAKENYEYKKILLGLILEKAPNLLQDVVKELPSVESIQNMSIDDKIETSFGMQSFSSQERQKLTKIFLTENNEEILINTLNSITKDDPVEVANLILKLFYTKKSFEVIKLAIKKYALILKNDSLTQIKRFMRVIYEQDVILTCLEEIKRYGDYTDYEFLKNYLKNSYSEKINLAALKAIIQTTYKTDSENVLNTLNFILRKGKESLALYSIKFYMENSINKNFGIVLYRLRQKESTEMKKTAIEYIDLFNLTSGVPLLEELSYDTNEEIQKKANELLKKFGESSISGEK